MKKDEVGLSQRPKKFGSISDYQDSNAKNEQGYISVIEQSNLTAGKSKGTSVGKGLFAIGALTLSIVGMGWFSWSQVPDKNQIKNYFLDSIPGIERVEKLVNVKTEPSDPLYEIHALMNDGNELRVDIKVHYKVKNDGGPIGKGHHKNMVRMAVRKVISQYNIQQLYTMDRLKIESYIHDELQKKYFKDIIEVEIYSFDILFDARTKAMFDARTKAKMEVDRANQEVEITKIHKRVVEVEMVIREYEQKRRLRLEREKLLYEAETQKMVDDIKKKKMDAK